MKKEIVWYDGLLGSIVKKDICPPPEKDTLSYHLKEIDERLKRIEKAIGIGEVWKKS